jgi:hypothetical protein
MGISDKIDRASDLQMKEFGDRIRVDFGVAGFDGHFLGAVWPGRGGLGGNEPIIRKRSPVRARGTPLWSAGSVLPLWITWEREQAPDLQSVEVRTLGRSLAMIWCDPGAHRRVIGLKDRRCASDRVNLGDFRVSRDPNLPGLENGVETVTLRPVKGIGGGDRPLC